ncbi:MAG TPA: FG-GAP-like repeat-containing protein [Gaiellaceae bacterium]
MRRLLASAGLLVLVGSVQAAGLPSKSAPSFVPGTYRTAESPQSVAIGDLNGDSRPDLVAAHGFIGGEAKKLRYLRAVSVLLNRGNGRFGTARVYPTGKAGDEHGAWSVAIGDLNGDGRADLATANPGGHSVSVLFNLGDGRFQPSIDYAIGREPWDVAIDDLNDDGKPDVVTANPNTVSVLLNRGDGNLAAKLDYPTGRDTWALAVGDLNGDRKPDLAIASHTPSTVSVLVNRGDGSFQPSLEYRTGPGPTSLAIGDLNGDGRSDLVTANGSSSPEGEDDWVDTVSVLLNRGGGTFRAKRDYRARVDDTLEFSSVAIGDLNGDGKPDIATADGDDYAVSALLNRGNGRFRRRFDYERISLVKDGLGYGARAIAIGDLNGDRKPDVVTPRWAYLSVFINTPGLCTVPRVEGVALRGAEQALASAHCRVGKIRRTKSYLKSGCVFSQSPQPGTMVVRRGGRVNLWVSNGQRPS